MPSPKYPLNPLLEHRERKVRSATVEVGDAVRVREVAEAAHVRAEGTRREAEERAARVKAEEADRLARGELRVADLARSEAWEIGARAQIDQLTKAAGVAEAKADRARHDEAGARGQLAQRMTDRDVVAKDAARFADRVQKRVVAAEEEEAGEAYRGAPPNISKRTQG